MALFGFVMLSGVGAFVLLSELARRRPRFAMRPLPVDRRQRRRSSD